MSQNGTNSLDYELQNLLNLQIFEELSAAQFYKSCYCLYSKPHLNLPGLASFFLNSFKEEETHAQNVIDYINLRNGTAIIPALKAPLVIKDGSYEEAVNSIEASLALEEKLTCFVVDLHKRAEELGDCHLSSRWEDTFIPEQYLSLANMTGSLNKLKRMGPGLGYQKFDDSLL